MMDKRDSDELGRLMHELTFNTDPRWDGSSLPVKGSISPSVREEVNKIGLSHGCHTCLTSLEYDFDQPWIADHIPPKGLREEIKWDYLEIEGATVLLPVCDRCSKRQSDLVKDLNKTREDIEGVIGALDDTKIKLLKGGSIAQVNAPGCTDLSGRRYEGPEEVLMDYTPKPLIEVVRNQGKRDGCHVCGTLIPKSKYIVDHVPCTELSVSSWGREVFKRMFNRFPPEPRLYPQCPRCMHKQAGDARTMAGLLLKYCVENRIYNPRILRKHGKKLGRMQDMLRYDAGTGIVE